jgi:hypothetical protein
LASCWKTLRRKERDGKKLKRKHCGEKDEIGYLYETEMMLEKSGRGEEDKVEEKE